MEGLRKGEILVLALLVGLWCAIRRLERYCLLKESRISFLAWW